jgi:hypothetical protein
MRIICLTALLGLSSLATHGAPIDLAPDALTPETYNPAVIVKTVNLLIGLGKKDAETSLLNYAIKPADPHIFMDRENRDYDVAWLCLLIYDPKPGTGLPWPELGGPAFPETGATWSRPLGRINSATWPRFPLAVSRGVPFLLAPGYLLAGQEEPGSMFLKRCQANGSFHTTPYAAPTRAEAESALSDLISSPEWKALAWHESTSSSHLHDNENREIEFLRSQVARIQ